MTDTGTVYFFAGGASLASASAARRSPGLHGFDKHAHVLYPGRDGLGQEASGRLKTKQRLHESNSPPPKSASSFLLVFWFILSFPSAGGRPACGAAYRMPHGLAAASRWISRPRLGH